MMINLKLYYYYLSNIIKFRDLNKICQMIIFFIEIKLFVII